MTTLDLEAQNFFLYPVKKERKKKSLCTDMLDANQVIHLLLTFVVQRDLTKLTCGLVILALCIGHQQQSN